MRLAFHTLDVFTETRFGGNPLAVVRDADGLTSETMQRVAREFNLSETVFVLKPENPVHTARMRIFTPTVELPFAGHPTVGTAILLAALRGQVGAGGDAIIALEQKIGTVRVGVRQEAGKAASAEFDAPKLPDDIGSPPDAADIASAVGLTPTEIGFENHKPSHFSAGSPFLFVPVRSLEAIGSARPVLERWDASLHGIGAAFLYCRETVHAASRFHARMFAPGMGMPEDPATGSAAVSLAAVIQRFDQPPGGEHRYCIEQGFEMGRPSFIHLSIAVSGDQLNSVRIAGHAVRVTDGEIEI
jgi:trans-2,3-dihydro-3-hydroxyanthranilate isomerase